MKHWRLITSVLCLVAIMFLFSIPRATAQQKTIKLNYATFWPVGHPATNLINEWAKEVEKRTNGTVTVTIFSSSTLLTPDKCYDGVVKGIAHIGVTSLSYTRGRFPFMELTDLPLGYKNGLIGTRMINALYEKYRPKELDDTKVMYFQSIGPGIVHTKKEVRTLEDLKGVRLSCSGLTGKVAAALGATPVAQTMPERYDALSKGIVDGVIGVPIASLWGFKWGELVKYTTQNFGSSVGAAHPVFMNKNVWNSLPENVKKTIENINKEWIDKSGKMWDDYDRMGLEYALKLGNKVGPLSKEEDDRWARQVRVTFDDYLRNTKEKGLPGDEALQFCRDFLKAN